MRPPSLRLPPTVSSTSGTLAQSSHQEGAGGGGVLGGLSPWGQQQQAHLPSQSEYPGSLSSAHRRALSGDDSPFHGGGQRGSEKRQDMGGAKIGIWAWKSVV